LIQSLAETTGVIHLNPEIKFSFCKTGRAIKQYAVMDMRIETVLFPQQLNAGVFERAKHQELDFKRTNEQVVDTIKVDSIKNNQAGVNTVAIGVDILRATSVMLTALMLGVTAIHPVSSTQEAFFQKEFIQTDLDPLLAGEVEGLPPEGFDLGNSPVQMIQHLDRLNGRPLVMSTTNGTVMLNTLKKGFQEHHLQDAQIWIGAFLNATDLIDQIVQNPPQTLLIASSGQKGRPSLEDTGFAGYLAQRLNQHQQRSPFVSDLSWDDATSVAMAVAEAYPTPAALFKASRHGQRLESLGLSEDLAYCAQTDLLSGVPTFHWLGSDSGTVQGKVLKKLGAMVSEHQVG
jgi:2-phosphosulfolactate phosphatase